MTYRTLIATLADEYRSRHEGNPPPAPLLLREPWIGRYLSVMFPAAARPLETEAPMQGGGAVWNCPGYVEADNRPSTHHEVQSWPF